MVNTNTVSTSLYDLPDLILITSTMLTLVQIAGSNGYMKLPSQACSAISSAWSRTTYSWPTGIRPNWQSFTSTLGKLFRTPLACPQLIVVQARRIGPQRHGLPARTQVSGGISRSQQRGHGSHNVETHS